MMRDWTWVLLAAVFLVAGYFLPQLDWFDSAQSVDIVEQDCNLKRQDCAIQWQEREFILSINPKEMSALQPMNITFKAPEPNVGHVSIEFEGVNMEMGYNRVVLQPDGRGNYSAVAILPACSLEKMQWLFHLVVEKAGHKTDFQFSVETFRR